MKERMRARASRHRRFVHARRYTSTGRGGIEPASVLAMRSLSKAALTLLLARRVRPPGQVRRGSRPLDEAIPRRARGRDHRGAERGHEGARGEARGARSRSSRRRRATRRSSSDGSTARRRRTRSSAREAESLGKNADKLLQEKGLLSSALEEAKARLEELRRAQAAADARAALFRQLALKLQKMIRTPASSRSSSARAAWRSGSRTTSSSTPRRRTSSLPV